MMQQFKDWILYQDLQPYDIDDETLGFDFKNATAQVVFNANGIIELDVIKKGTKDHLFYLHFQINDLDHAKELFNEMVATAKAIKEANIHRILFCCTSGLTTGFFASKMNEAFEVLELPYHCDAVSYQNLFTKSKDYELLCIAPQIHYNYERISMMLPNLPVIKIPSKVFASYDSKAMLKLIEDNLTSVSSIDGILHMESYRDLKIHEGKVLCVSLIRNSNRTHIDYAIYDGHNFLVDNQEVIKPFIVLQDIYDAIDVALARHPDIEMIGLSLPGIISQEKFISANYVDGLNNHHLEELFTHKYHKQFLFTNDINAAVVGFYSAHNNYENISFLYQPLYYRAGVGNIVNGKLLVGAHHLSGELKLIPLDISDETLNLIKTPDGALEVVSKYIVALTTTLDPEAVAVCSQLVPNMDELHDEVAKLLGNDSYVPDLIYVEQMHLYMFLGQLILCIEALLQKNND